MTYRYKLDPNYTDYDTDKAKDLVGKTVKYMGGQDWLVHAYVHHHFLLLRQDGFFTMSYAVHLLESVEEQEAQLALKQDQAIQNLFREKGVLYHEGTYIVWAMPSDFVGNTGATVDERQFESGAHKGKINAKSDMYPHLGWSYKFGSNDNNQGYRFYHTWIKDPSKPFGFDVRSGGDQVDLSKGTWMSFQSIAGHAMMEYNKQFEGVYKPGQVMRFSAKGSTIVFTDDVYDKEYYRRVFKFQHAGTMCYLDAFFQLDGKKEATNGESGRHKEKFSVPKDMQEILWSELKDMLLGHIYQSLLDSTSESPEARAERFLSGASVA